MWVRLRRHPTGADSVMLAELHQSLPEQDFITRMRTMFGGGPAKNTGLVGAPIFTAQPDTNKIGIGQRLP
jgi:hypothetical protein